MGRSYKTEGIILKRVNFGEADKILTIYTKHYGKIRIMAKGVRKLTSRKGGNVELFNLGTIFVNRGKNFDYLTEIQTIKSFKTLRKDLKKVATAYYFCELIDKLTPEAQPSRGVLEILKDFFERISFAENKEELSILSRSFEEILLKELGFGIPAEVQKYQGSLRPYIETIIEKKIISQKIAAVLLLALLFLNFTVIPVYSVKETISEKIKSFPPPIAKPIPGSFLVEFGQDPEIVIVKGKSTSEKQSVLSRKFLDVTEKFETLGVKEARSISSTRRTVYLLSIPKRPPEEVIRNFEESRNVLRVEQDYAFPVSFFPNDPYFRNNQQGNPKDYYQWNLAAINAPAAWDVTKGNSSVKVAVIDTGLAFEDYLGFRKAPELVNVNILAGKRFIYQQCDEFCNCTNLANPIIDEHANDEVGHGTHVALTIVQAMNNGQHATGLASNVSILPVKVAQSGPGGCMSTSAVLSAYDFVKTQGVHVVNMSYGGSYHSTIEEGKINELYNAGVTLVAASGNSASRSSSPSVLYPAAYPNVISVGATRWDNIRAYYSQYGAGLTLVAPGGQVINDAGSAVNDQNNDGLGDGIVQQTIVEGQPSVFTSIKQVPACNNQKCWFVYLGSCRFPDESCGLMQGTSMASPHVTAVVALLKSVNPSLTPLQIKNILIQTANKTVIPGYNQNEYGAGLVDAHAAILAAAPISTPTGPQCPGGSNGNLNCDPQGLINIDDLNIMKGKWSPNGPVPTPNPAQFTADITSDGKVNEADISKLLGFWHP